MPAGFYYKSLALGICFRLITMNVFQWSDGLPIKSFLGGENMNLHLTPDVNQGNRGKVGSRFSCVVSGMDSLFGSSVRC